MENSILMGNVHQLRGDFSEADKYYNFYTQFKKKAKEIELEGMFWKIQLDVYQGKINTALENIERAIRDSIDYKLNYFASEILINKAYISLQKNDYRTVLDSGNDIERISEEHYSHVNIVKGKFLKTLALHYLNRRKQFEKDLILMKNHIEKKINRKHLRYYWYLRGAVSESNSHYTKAIEFFDRAYKLLSSEQGYHDEHAFFLEALARCLFKNKEYTLSMEYFKKIINLTSGRLTFGIIYSRSFFFLGRISQMKGWEGKAIEYYQEFLKLWQDADHSFPEIEYARNQLGLLDK
jgi:tetratricopeptide (TPR) repeat protein